MTDDEAGEAASEVVVRRARPADADAVAAFTRDTWGERQEDYVPRVFAEWAASDDATRRTFVATLPHAAADAATPDGDGVDPETVVEGDGTGAVPAGDPEAVVGCIQGVMLSEWEAWGQAIRVNRDVRGKGVSTHLSEAVFDWAREAGAAVCRNMVFSWNVAGLGQSRAVGFGPETEFRFAHPEPEPDSNPDPDSGPKATGSPSVVTDPNPNDVWAFWEASDACSHLRGLALDPDETWACSRLTRERLAAAAAGDRLLAVEDGGVAGFAVRTRLSEYASDDGPETAAEYGVAAWRDASAAGAVFDAVARDAAAADADAVRVLIPETVTHVSDAAANRVAVADEPDFVLRADLTDPSVGSGG